MKKTAFIYCEGFGSADYGFDHPMRPLRLKLTFDMIKEKGLISFEDTELIEARKATEEELLSFHTPDYIRALKESDSGSPPKDGYLYGLGYGDNPTFKGVFEWSRLVTGASLDAARLVGSGEKDIAFNIGGGLHHALKARASGFCYINDPVVAIKYLLGLDKRVCYVDIDAHHGDGVELEFYDTDRVLTISLHESGEYLFPGTGFPKDMGGGKGRGYAVNLPFPPFTDDELFLTGFNEIVPCFVEAFKPDVLVTQLGVDTFMTDPITHLNLTTNGFETMVERFRSFRLPWVALGGGGYNMDNVKRAWTIAWAIMNHKEAPRDLRDAPFNAEVPEYQRRKVEEDIGFLKKEVLPLIKAP